MAGFDRIVSVQALHSSIRVSTDAGSSTSPSSSTSVCAVEVSGLSKRYDGHAVFEDLNLSVARGEVVAALGPSGCGKSTLLRCIAGLVRPDAGSARADGEVAVVFQEPRLLPWLRVDANVRFAARSANEAARVPGLLDRVGLTGAAHQLPKQLSGGMAHRTALARALVRRPDALLLDEPLAALDALRRLELQDLLAEIVADTGAAVVLVTHDVDEALYLADRIVVLQGSPSRIVLELKTEWPRPRDRVAVAAGAERATLLSTLGVRH